MEQIKNVGLFVNTSKANAAGIVEGVCVWLRERALVPLLSMEEAGALGQPESGMSRAAVVAAADVLIVLGGDGTLLSAAHTPQIERVPILAINIGTLGFLTDASLDELYPALDALLTGAYRIEHRMVLEVVVNSQAESGVGPEPFRAFALNDVVISHYMHIIELDAYVDGEFFIPYNADGLIIATPSGSTGYSLSCAGTIVEPQLEAILLTPIAPHSLTVRPFIAHGDAEISVKMRATYRSVDVFVDGQRETHSLTAGAVIRIKKAERTIQLIRSQHHSYYRALREKLMLGERIKAGPANR